MSIPLHKFVSISLFILDIRTFLLVLYVLSFFFFFFIFYSSNQSNAPEVVAFSSSSLKSGNTSGNDFWSTELAWQRDELAKAFVVSVSTIFLSSDVSQRNLAKERLKLGGDFAVKPQRSLSYSYPSFYRSFYIFDRKERIISITLIMDRYIFPYPGTIMKIYGKIYR